jgi:hypothetical protein
LSQSPTENFFEELKRILSDILPLYLDIDGREIRMFYNGVLTDTAISFLLCRYKKRIRRIKRNIREGNKKYKIAKDELDEWESNIISILGIKSLEISRVFKDYRTKNKDLPVSRNRGKKVLNFHPNLKMDYFENINTKKKAYWLGFLWAEVYLGVNNEVTLDLSNKDEILIDRFIKDLGLNPDYKSSRNRLKKSGLKSYVRIRFKCEKIVNDLKNLGHVPSGLKRTKFPIIENRELDLAFLLGFFDGDGKEGTTQFHIGSKPILEAIKQKFKLKNQIRPDGVGNYYFSLGGKLFNEMLDNYPNSLERKRKYFRIPSRVHFEDSINEKLLSELVWKYPIKKISEMYHTYPKIVREICDNWEIKRPTTHYWHKLLKGKKFEEYKNEPN